MLFDATIDGRTVRVEVRAREGRYVVTVDGRLLEVDHQETGPHFASLIIGGKSYEAGLEKRPDGYNVVLADAGPARILAPMPGRLVRVLVQPGQEVREGDGLVVVEAMKMENELRSPRAGR